ncbi:MAG: hypothetical protein Q7V05_00380, partial [Methanoregula sp.]|nr:hypothetical protein [Methanoregula sp.]
FISAMMWMYGLSIFSKRQMMFWMILGCRIYLSVRLVRHSDQHCAIWDECMDTYDFSAIERELRYQDFMIHYLQDEQKKRREELDKIERDLAKLQNDPKFIILVNLAAKKN